MGSRKNWPQALADRFQAVGWEVKLGAGGHFKVRRPDGQLMSWPQSPSGNRTLDNKLAEARRFGLHEAEEELDERREAERQARIERDRFENGVPDAKFLPPYKEIEAKLAEAVYSIPTPEPSPEKEDANVTKYGFIEVEGVKLGIAEIAKPVMHRHPRGGEPHELAHCRELLLVDDSIRYQCLKLLPGPDGKICARHFATSAGLVVHWNRGSHADAARTSAPQERDLGGVLPVEPKPEERPGPSTYELIVDCTPSKITTEPDTQSQAAQKEEKPMEEARPIAVEQPGVMARMEDLGQQLLDVHFEAQRLANHAQDLHQTLASLAKDVHREIASDEVREKAQKFDRMMKAVGQ